MKTRTSRCLWGMCLGTFWAFLPCFSKNESAVYQPAPENLQAREVFKTINSVFSCIGVSTVCSVRANGICRTKTSTAMNMPKACFGFYPAKFNAHDWVAAIKDAGAKYICITTRHHDGFSMFDTRYSDYDIVDATPFKRDILKELADECHKQGIKLHLYYSHLDWTREDYYPLGRTGHGTGRTGHGEWKTYYQFMNNQLTELLTNYGEIGAIWFDGRWDHAIHRI